MDVDAKIRLYVDQPIGSGQALALPAAQAHYLFSVMRLSRGQKLRVFNGRDGEWLAQIEDITKKQALLHCHTQLKSAEQPPDIWLLFTPLRKERTHFMIEKAVELGVSRLLPIYTDYTNGERWRHDRHLAHIIEASEQCGATFLAELSEPQKLSKGLADWPESRKVFWADEDIASHEPDTSYSTADTISTIAQDTPQKPAALLIGPEGGFSAPERTWLRSLPFVQPITLGRRILRAETAAITALALWHYGRGYKG